MVQVDLGAPDVVAFALVVDGTQHVIGDARVREVAALAAPDAAHVTLADFLDERLFKPLGMTDTAFFVAKDKLGRLADGLPVDASTGKPIKLYDVTAVPNNDSGGAVTGG